MGNLVHFGEEICMMHHDSGYYIKGCPDISETTVIGTKTILTKNLDSRCYLKLFSRFKSKKLGDAVSLDDEVLIENSVEKQYLDYDDQAYDFNYEFNPDKEDPFRPLTYFVDPHCTSHKIFMTMKKEKFWTFIKFRNNTSHRSNSNGGGALRGDPIKGLDLIYINNPEMKSHLCSDLIYFDKEPQIFYRRYLGLYDDEKINLNCIW